MSPSPAKRYLYDSPHPSSRSPEPAPAHPSQTPRSTRSQSRSQSRNLSRSISEALQSTFEGVEHVAHDVESVARVVGTGAGQVERLSQTGQELVRTVSSDWSELDRGKNGTKDGSESTDAEDASAREDEEKALDTTQDRVDDLFDQLEHIAVSRHQLTGTPYQLGHLSLTAPTSSIPVIERSTNRERRHFEKLVATVVRSKLDLVETYRLVCALAPRYANLKSRREGRGDRGDDKLAREFATLNASFAKVLDFVEDCARDEARDGAEGTRDERFLRRIEDEEPGWDRSKRLAVLKKVKEDAKFKHFENLEFESWTAKWMVEGPFTELDRTALQAIDVEENQKATRRPSSTTAMSTHGEKNHGKGMGVWLSNVFHFGPPSGTSRSTRKVPSTPSMLEMGHQSSKSGKSRPRRSTESHELSHASRSRRASVSSSSLSTPLNKGAQRKARSYPESDAISTDSDEATDVEKQRRGLIPIGETQVDKEVDNTEIPYRVPSDDTSGYVETPEELRMDQRERIESEHFWTPVVVVEWILILVMILYWAITRGMGYRHSLGNVDLGRIVGNDFWSDTLPRTGTEALAPSPSPTTAIDATIESSVGPAAPSGNATAIHASSSESSTESISSFTARDHESNTTMIQSRTEPNFAALTSAPTVTPTTLRPPLSLVD